MKSQIKSSRQLTLSVRRESLRKITSTLLALLLALSLMPALALSAYADEVGQIETGVVLEDVNAPQNDGTVQGNDTVQGGNAEESVEYAGEKDIYAPNGDIADVPDEALAGEQGEEFTGSALGSNDFETLAEPERIELLAQETGQLSISNKWNSTVVVLIDDVYDASIESANTYTLSVTSGQKIEVEESTQVQTFRSWNGAAIQPFVAGVKCAITSIPAMSAFTTDVAGTTAGDYFFYNFGRGSLTAIPDGSFDTSGITTAGNYFFAGFNNHGFLTTLPTGSFDTSHITSVGTNFFSYFNSVGSLVSLPQGSFDISEIDVIGNSFFAGFNYGGSLKSFPAGSFDTSNITTVGDGFFSFFSAATTLASLPEGSFNTSRITDVGDSFFVYFVHGSNLTSLPQSFRLPEVLNSVGSSYCGYLFSDSSLVRGNQSVPLYFAEADSRAFLGTSDIVPDNPAAHETVYVNGAEDYFTRLNGNDRIATMKEIVERGWISASTVIVASAANFPDALAASALAGISDAPVILTDPTELSADAKVTIENLKATKAYVIGGASAVSDTVLQSIRGITDIVDVERLSGASRTETALAIYEEGAGSWGTTAIVANGSNFADALSISPFAFAEKAPLFLAFPGTGLDTSTAAAINAGGFSRVIIVGGEAAVPDIVKGQLTIPASQIDRLSGATRYETSAEIAKFSVSHSTTGLDYDQINCATGGNYPDALAGGAFAGHMKTVLLLVDDNVDGRYGLTNILSANKASIYSGFVLGGTAAVSEELFNDLNEALKR